MLRISTLIIIAFATVFFPRLATYFGAPAPLNFFHFLTIPPLFLLALTTARRRQIKHIKAATELMAGLGLLLGCMTISALLNDAGFVNLMIQYLILSEPYLFLLVFLLSPLNKDAVRKCKAWLLGFCSINLVLALAQSVLIPAGIYPRRGGTIADGIGGVFGGGGGSAANYVSSTVSLYAALYFFAVPSRFPAWLKVMLVMAAIYQTQISDSKQVFLAVGLAGLLILASKIEKPTSFLKYTIVLCPFLIGLFWVYNNTDFFIAYKNWISREGIFDFDGDAIQTKIASFPIVISYFSSPLNWLFGIGPGHSVSRLGGWMLEKYSWLLLPLGASIHPASSEVFNVVRDGWIAQQSTVFFPLFTWAGIWGDFGFVGVGIYVYLGAVVFRRLCKTDLARFLLISTAIFGLILTQMEEPGHTLTVAYIIGLQANEGFPSTNRKKTLNLKT